MLINRGGIVNKKELEKLISTLKIEKSEYWILSSASLVLRGIYDSAADLDLAVTEKGLKELKENYDLEQKENILTICAKLNSSDKLIIRKHPRDETNYHELLKSFTDLKKIEINTDKPIEFLHTIHSKSYLIGSFSTLALEAMQLGGNFFPLHLHSHKNLNHLLKQYKLPPKKIDEINEIETIIEYSHSINLLSPYNPTIILNILK